MSLGDEEKSQKCYDRGYYCLRKAAGKTTQLVSWRRSQVKTLIQNISSFLVESLNTGTVCIWWYSNLISENVQTPE